MAKKNRNRNQDRAATTENVTAEVEVQEQPTAVVEEQAPEEVTVQAQDGDGDQAGDAEPQAGGEQDQPEAAGDQPEGEQPEGGAEEPKQETTVTVVAGGKSGREVIGSYARRLILENPEMSNKDIAAKVQEDYPGASTSPACIAWYKWDMRKNGQLPEASRQRYQSDEERKAARNAASKRSREKKKQEQGDSHPDAAVLAEAVEAKLQLAEAQRLLAEAQAKLAENGITLEVPETLQVQEETIVAEAAVA